MGTIGLDNEVDGQAVGGPRLGRPDDGHQCSSGSNQACGPLPDVAADDIQHEIDFADIFEDVVLEVDELLRAEVEHALTVGGASGADDVGAGLPCELRHHRPDGAGRAVHEDALPRLKAAMLEQSLPRGQARDWQARAHREVDVARQRREVANGSGLVLLGLLFGFAGTLGATIHGAYDVANLLHAPGGVVDPMPVDPRGLLTFGISGLGVLALSWEALGNAALPRTLGWLGVALGLLLVVIYLGRLIVFDANSLLLLAPAGLGAVISIAWYAMVGQELLREARA